MSQTVSSNEALDQTADRGAGASAQTAKSAGDVKFAPIVTRLDQCRPVEVEWLWRGRVPVGKLTLLVGDPGLGKSFLSLDLAARVTRGAEMPRVSGDPPMASVAPGSVVLLSAEDSVNDTIRPRLAAAGADLSRVVALQAVGVREKGSDRVREMFFSLSDSLGALEEVIASLGDCRLVVIDPISAYLGKGDSHNNAEMRRLLTPLSALAERTGVAVLAISHLNKASYGAAIYRAIGSVAFMATARSGLAVLADPDEPAARVLVALKSNLAASAPGIRYRIGSSGDAKLPVVEWDPTPVELTANELLVESAKSAGERSATLEAAEWLTEMLRNGPQSATDIKLFAATADIDERTLLRAKARLGVVSRRQGFGPLGTWIWKWPENRPLPERGK